MIRLPKVFHSKLFFAGAIIAVLVLAFLQFKQWRTSYLINKEIKALEAQEKNLLEQNKSLESNISFLNTPEYQEKLSRMQFNLKKEGEVVVDLTKPSDSQKIPETESINKTNNLIKWWEYLFN